MIKNSTKIHKKYGSHWFYLTESLENIGGNKRTGGPPLTRKSLTRFQLTRSLAYVCVSGGISVSTLPADMFGGSKPS